MKPRRQGIFQGGDWLPRLITWGPPVVLAAVGVVVLVTWSRVQPEVGQPQARVPAAQVVPPTASTLIPESPVSPSTVTPGPETPPGMDPGMSMPPPPPGEGLGAPPPGGPGPDFPPPTPAAGGMGSSPSSAAPASLPGSWPQYRGQAWDNINKETVALAQTWPSGGPKKLWTVQLGEGHGGAAVHNSRVYVLDYDTSARADKLRCFALADGRELWHTSYPVDIKRNHGISRTVPTVTDKHVVTIGPKCHVMCADAASGKVLWKLDMVQKWGATVPTWYTGQCPLVEGSRVILAPGGKALLVAVDLASGKVLWETPNPKGWKMTHASIVPTAIGGKKVYLYPASGGVAAISPDGKVLWETEEWRVSTATIPCAIPIGDGRVFFCGGYNAGSIMFRLTAAGAGLNSEVLYRLKPTVFGSDQQTPILYQGHIYGVVPGGQMACLSLDGKQLWTSGTRRYGLGPYMLAGGLMYALEDKTGTLTLARISPQAYQVLATAKVVPGPDAWAPLALAGGRMLLRDVTTMVCLDVSGR